MGAGRWRMIRGGTRPVTVAMLGRLGGNSTSNGWVRILPKFGLQVSYDRCPDPSRFPRTGHSPLRFPSSVTALCFWRRCGSLFGSLVLLISVTTVVSTAVTLSDPWIDARAVEEANLTQVGDAKPRDSLSWPGRRNGTGTCRPLGNAVSQGLER